MSDNELAINSFIILCFILFRLCDARPNVGDAHGRHGVRVRGLVMSDCNVHRNTDCCSHSSARLLHLVTCYECVLICNLDEIDSIYEMSEMFVKYTDFSKSNSIFTVHSGHRCFRYRSHQR